MVKYHHVSCFFILVLRLPFQTCSKVTDSSLSFKSKVLTRMGKVIYSLFLKHTMDILSQEVQGRSFKFNIRCWPMQFFFIFLVLIWLQTLVMFSKYLLKGKWNEMCSILSILGLVGMFLCQNQFFFFETIQKFDVF